MLNIKLETVVVMIAVSIGVFASFVGSLSAAALVAIQEDKIVATAEAETNEQFFEDSLRLCLCSLGSLSGALLAVGVFAPPDASAHAIRRLCIKFFASILCGILFTPIFMWLFSIPNEPKFVGGTACIVAIVIVPILHKLGPWIESLSPQSVWEFAKSLIKRNL